MRAFGAQFDWNFGGRVLTWWLAESAVDADLVLETGPRHHEEDVHYHIDAHIPPYLPIPHACSRDYDPVAPGLHHIHFESCVR